jgi:hypothetical protein
VDYFRLALISLLFFSSAFSEASFDYYQQITELRAERDARFKNPITSPLAQVGGELLKDEETIFGSSSKAQLRWRGEGIEPVHLRVIMQGDRVFLEPASGSVLDHETGAPAVRQEWKTDQMFRAGSVLLVLRDHPVGPIVRIIDPNSDKVSGFAGLQYFHVDEMYRVRAQIRPLPPKRIKIADTQGWERPARLFGRLEFTINQQPQQLDLILFGEEGGEESGFLIMFRDQTSGKETYGACRYLHLPYQSEGELWLDFNRATNPSCAYASSFACPLPPPDNRLTVPIRAGEKTFAKRDH